MRLAQDFPSSVSEASGLIEEACNGTISSNIAAPNQDLTMYVQSGPALGTVVGATDRLYLRSLSGYPALGLPGTEATWKYTSSTAFSYKMIALGFTLTGTGSNNPNTSVRTLNSAISADGPGGCIKVYITDSLTETCPNASMTRSTVAIGDIQVAAWDTALPLDMELVIASH